MAFAGIFPDDENQQSTVLLLTPHCVASQSLFLPVAFSQDFTAPFDGNISEPTVCEIEVVCMRLFYGFSIFQSTRNCGLSIK